MRYVLILLVFGLTYVGCSGSDRSKSFNSTAPATLTVATTALPSGRVGVFYDFTLQGAGGTPPYNWAFKASEPGPPGLTLDMFSGQITGFPNNTYTGPVGIEIRDAVGDSIIVDLPFVIQ